MDERQTRRPGADAGTKRDDGHASGGTETLRSRWFGGYPTWQTAAALVLALVCTTAFSIDPTVVTDAAIRDIDPNATGALYICYEVLLSFAGNIDAVVLLALGVMLMPAVRYAVFARGALRRPAVVVPAVVFAVCMIFGRSYDELDSAALAIGSISHTIESVIAGAGFALFAAVAVELMYEAFDWLGAHRVPFSERRYGRIWRIFDAVLNRRPFLIPLIVLLVAWAPTFVASMPGIFMGDTGAQIRQWFNLPNGTSSYLNLINPDVLLNGHHPVVHTALVGSCVELGMRLFGDENAGVLIYTTLQTLVSAACLAYAVSSLRRLGVGLLPRALALAFFACMPMVSNYAVLITKDVLFADAFVLLMIEMAKLIVPDAAARRCTVAPGTAVPSDVRTFVREEALDASASPAGRSQLEAGVSMRGLAALSYPGQAVPFTVRDGVLLAVGALGCTFLRNGGVAFPLAACLLAAALLFVDRRRLRAVGRPVRHPRRLAVALAVAVAALAAQMVFSNVVMPALDITPGSRREALSIPFQQTARFVAKHDAQAGGVDGGGSDGLVTDEERAAIDVVLDYDTLASRYDPDKSDDVKNEFNEDATADDLERYFQAWWEMLWKDPACYLSALANNYYGYFYPSEKDVWIYSTQSSAEIMARDENRRYFDFHRATGPAVDVCDAAVNLYRTAVQRIPVLSLTMNSSTYVWILILLACYLMRGRQWRSLALVVPLAGVLAVCLIGPCNGSTYMRYLYPLILALPFTIPLLFTGARPLWRR